jgi:hypothetical protein
LRTNCAFSDYMNMLQSFPAQLGEIGGSRSAAGL